MRDSHCGDRSPHLQCFRHGALGRDLSRGGVSTSRCVVARFTRDRLAGERGRAIVAAAPRTIRKGLWLVARTKVIVDVIIEAIAEGCDKVLNLAVGLDTRPYRLNPPPDFAWVEADLPELLAEKERGRPPTQA